MGKIIAITGAAGYLGRVLIAHLLAQPWAERIIALDTKPVLADGRVISHSLDIREISSLRAILAEHGVTHFIHAAFIINKSNDISFDQMRSINVDGSQLALKTAFELGVEQITFISSVSVYGYRGGNPALVAEHHRSWPNMAYAHHKMQVEAYLRDIEPKYPDTRSVVIRPTAIAGPRGRTVSPLLALVAQPVFVLSNGGHARTQAVHEDDLARLISRSIEVNAAGIFNAAPNDHVAWTEIAALSRRRPLSLPRPLLNIAARLSPFIPDLNGFTREIVDYFSESLVADNTLAKQTLGWSPHFGTLDAFGQLFGVKQIPREQRIGATR